MGEPKALLQWGKGTVLEHHLHVWTSAGAGQVAVVMDPQNAPVREELGRLKWEDVILNDHPENGMMSSLREAASWSGWAKGLDHVLVVLVDQPQFPLAVARELVKLVKLAGGHPQDVCQPQHGDRRGHPVVLPWRVFLGIAETTADTLRDYLRMKEAPRKVLGITDPGWMEDMDTPDAYQSLRERYGRQD
jgi:molybdenum cofactor cytidylyltransferase